MSSSEFVKSTQAGAPELYQSWGESDWLESLTPEELLQNIADQWEHCECGFNDLFKELNKTSVEPIDVFDIQVESEQIGDAVLNTYIRLWREDNVYNTQRMVLANGKVIDRSDTEPFDKRAQYEMLESTRQRIIEGGSEIDEDVYLHDLKYKVYPSTVKTTDTLADLWDKVKEPLLNPQFKHLFPWLDK
jgi:hypothetical protein